MAEDILFKIFDTSIRASITISDGNTKEIHDTVTKLPRNDDLEIN